MQMIWLDYAFKAFAIMVIAWFLLDIGLQSKLPQINITVLSFALLVVAIAVFSGAPLLVTDFLYSEALTFTKFADLLLVLALTAAFSALFLTAEDPAVEVLERLGVDRLWAGTGFTFLHGIITALSLVVAARLIPGVELVTSAALSAGLIGAFGFYFAEQLFVHSGSVDTEEMALMEDSLEDEDY